MNLDIKRLYQTKAEEVAQDLHSTTFYDLSDSLQHSVFEIAMEAVHEDLAVQADLILGQLKEGRIRKEAP